MIPRQNWLPGGILRSRRGIPLMARRAGVCSKNFNWNERPMLEAIGSIVHLAYYVGAIRQIAHAAAGPPATR